MADSDRPGPLGINPRAMCAVNPGTLGLGDAASPDSPDWFRGNTPGSVGCEDGADPKFAGRSYLLEEHLRALPDMAPDPDLSNVGLKDLTDYVPKLHGVFKKDIDWASTKVGLNPGFLASVLLTEEDSSRVYTSKKGAILNDPACINSGCPPDLPGVCSYTVGTDTYRSEKDKIDKAIKAAKEVDIPILDSATHGNELYKPGGKKHIVTNLHFGSGHAAIFGVAVYLKYGEHMMRTKLWTFDYQPIAVQWGLIRLAMVPGIGAAQSRIEGVRWGKDIFVHGKIVRGQKRADSGMTRVVAIGLYLSEHVFGIPVNHRALAG